MRDFVELLEALEAATGTQERIAALGAHFRRAEAREAAWSLWLFLGGRLPRLLPSSRLRALAARASGLPEWLVEACHAHVGDLAETLAALVPGEPAGELPSLAALIEDLLLPLAAEPAAAREAAVLALWSRCGRQERFVLNKLLTGGWRLAVGRGLAIRALARALGRPEEALATALAGDWRPSAEGFRRLADPEGSAEDPRRPFPFQLACPLPGPAAALGPPQAWLAERKWDGIRAQLIGRRGAVALWSRGGERIEERFPELARAMAGLGREAALDGEILAWSGDRPLPFAQLQRRLQRRRPGALEREIPVRFLAFDCLELAGEDLRALPLEERRVRLAALLRPEGAPLAISPLVPFSSWAELEREFARSRELRVEGLMLKRRDAPYTGGRRRGAWWKWKLEPLSFDAVLVYAEPGHGRRAGLLTDYTFAVWDGDRLVPVAKAYSGLDEPSLEELDRWLRRNTLRRFGRVRAVAPRLVFEIGCEGVQPSNRHRAGLAVRFPRILRWHRDRDPASAERLDVLRGWLGGA